VGIEERRKQSIRGGKNERPDPAWAYPSADFLK